MNNTPANDITPPQTIPWHKSIRFRMVIGFSVLCTAILLIIQTIQFYGCPLLGIQGGLRQLQNQEFISLSAVADSRKKLITDWIAARRRNAHALSTLPVAQSGKIATDPTLKKPMSTWLEEVRTTYQLDAIRFIDTLTGRTVLTVPADAPPSVLSQQQLREAASPGIDEQILLTLGQNEGSSHLHLLHQVIGETTQNSRPKLLIELECSLDTMLKPQLELNMQGLLGKSGEVVLMNATGQFLTKVKHTLPDGQPIRPLETLNKARPALLALGGSEGTIEETDYRNVAVLAAYRHIQITPEMSWAMVVKKDRSEAFAHLKYQRTLFIMLGLFGIAAMTALAILIAHHITQPLRKMVATSHNISAGDLTARASVVGDNETAHLARAFNTMLNQLHAWHIELDNRVLQRTEQLEHLNKELQEQVTERTRAEDALHEKALQLEEEIAERQKAQEELQQLNNTLEQRITEAVNQLRQKDDLLIQQNRMAALGELLTNIAHQWRQPLNNIAVYIQTMQYLRKAGELTDQEMDRDIAEVMAILQYMSQTIDDFRSFFVRDRNNAQEFPVAPTIARALTLVTPALTANAIKVELLNDERQDLRVIGYPNEFIQVVMNILYNARDILLERGVRNPRIEIMVTHDNSKAVITIRDNGGGIEQQALPHIFDPYFTTKGPDKGSGIGLYMSKTIIEKNMGGTLTAHNWKEGAEFRIEL